MKRAFLFITLLVGMVSAAWAQVDDVTLVVSGEGITKDEATTKALRSAIEQAFGVFVSANTEILNDELVKDEIATISSGNVKSYKELGSIKKENGNTEVSLEATVSVKTLTSYAKSHGSSCEFSGATFAANIKLARLKSENTSKALANLVESLKSYSDENVYNCLVSIGNPQSIGYHACPTYAQLQQCMLPDGIWRDKNNRTLQEDMRIHNEIARSYPKYGRKVYSNVASYYKDQKQDYDYTLDGVCDLRKLYKRYGPRPMPNIAVKELFELPITLTYTLNGSYLLDIFKHIENTINALAITQEVAKEYEKMGIKVSNLDGIYLPVATIPTDKIRYELNRIMNPELEWGFTIVDNTGQSYGTPNNITAGTPHFSGNFKLDINYKGQYSTKLYITSERIGEISTITVKRDRTFYNQLLKYAERYKNETGENLNMRSAEFLDGCCFAEDLNDNPIKHHNRKTGRGGYIDHFSYFRVTVLFDNNHIKRLMIIHPNKVLTEDDQWPNYKY